jgi:hypothetical protein
MRNKVATLIRRNTNSDLKAIANSCFGYVYVSAKAAECIFPVAFCILTFMNSSAVRVAPPTRVKLKTKLAICITMTNCPFSIV